MGLFVD